ncbi:SGF29 tudor-like domain-containing protein [Cokeromyces recurvatus]|uniref:SGF29 tudor-like domain-containing protein n=1 Tax=Cokeromyces recurvatus TaxID=90255 RepID=UPI00221F09B5|nr:SGF29 tudor-like domain-containing protein [Cokeromyces recurvatus]KAI7903664.1 SGF29 tudor-like domain-containing protein [Cokeromyces recurvatus]
MDRKSRSLRSHEESSEEFNIWKQICSSLLKLEGIQKEEETVINSINKIQLSVDIEKGITGLIQQKLKENYKRGIELSFNESKMIQNIIEKLSVLIALRENEQADQKRKKRKIEITDTKVILNQSNNNHNSLEPIEILPKGTTVAARQPKEKDKNEEWILAVVIQYHTDKNKYQVEDVDQDDYGEKQRYMLSPRYVIPVPNSEEARSLPEIPAQEDVLALYPGTTCFYKAVVIAPPSKSKEIKNYRVQFEDDNDEVKYVMPEHILKMPK